MAKQLAYTSVPQGLWPGASGYCTVLSTEGLPRTQADFLERLSVYRILERDASGQVLASPENYSRIERLNPVNYAHVRFPYRGQDVGVLLKTSLAGFDYSKRLRKLSHFLVLDDSDRTPAGPAWLLVQPGVFLGAWGGNPTLVKEDKELPQGQLTPRPCTTWDRLAGDAGWAGELAASLDGGQPAYIVYQPGMEITALLLEATALVPPERRWDITFSTCYLAFPSGVICQWRFILQGSPEHLEIQGRRNALLIDLCGPPRRAPDIPATAAARQGAYFGGSLVQLADSRDDDFLLTPPAPPPPAPRVPAEPPPPFVPASRPVPDAADTAVEELSLAPSEHSHSPPPPPPTQPSTTLEETLRPLPSAPTLPASSLPSSKPASALPELPPAPPSDPSSGLLLRVLTGVVSLLLIAIIAAVIYNPPAGTTPEVAKKDPPFVVPSGEPEEMPYQESEAERKERQRKEQQRLNRELEAKEAKRKPDQRKEKEDQEKIQRENDEKNKTQGPVVGVKPTTDQPDLRPHKETPAPPQPPAEQEPGAVSQPTVSPAQPTPTPPINNAKKDSHAYAESLGKTAKVAGYDGVIHYLDSYGLLQLSPPPSTRDTAVPLGNADLAFAKPKLVTLKAEHLIRFGPTIDIPKDPQSLNWELHLKGERAPPSAIARIELRGGQFYFWWTPEFLAWRDLEPINNGAIVRWSLYNHLLIIGYDGDHSIAYQFFPPTHLRVAIPGKESLEEVLSFREVASSTAVITDSPSLEDGKWFDYAREYLEFAAETLKSTRNKDWLKDFDSEKKGNLPYLRLKELGDQVAKNRFELQCYANTHKANEVLVNFTMLGLVLKSNDPEPAKPQATGKSEEDRKKNEEDPSYKRNVAKWEAEVNKWKAQQKELPRLQAIVDHAAELKYPLRLVAKPKPGVMQTIIVAGFRP